VRYLACQLTKETPGKIAIETGHVTRPAVMNAVRQITHALSKDESLQRQGAAIRRELDATEERSGHSIPFKNHPNDSRIHKDRLRAVLSLCA